MKFNRATVARDFILMIGKSFLLFAPRDEKFETDKLWDFVLFRQKIFIGDYFEREREKVVTRGIKFFANWRLFRLSGKI